MHIISRLRDDAVLFYLNSEPEIGKRSVPEKYAGRVKPGEPDMNFFTLCYNTVELKIYNATVYCKVFGRNINLPTAVFYNENGKETARKLYLPTVLEMDGTKLVSCYRSRFQIEFIYRDAKQHCGLEHC
jgi:hypothetical protein